MVGHVALVAEDLLIRGVLPPADRTRAALALPPGVVLAEVAVRLLHPGHALSVATLVPGRLGAGLDAEDLVHKLDLDLLSSVCALPEWGILDSSETNSTKSSTQRNFSIVETSGPQKMSQMGRFSLLRRLGSDIVTLIKY